MSENSYDTPDPAKRPRCRIKRYGSRSTVKAVVDCLREADQDHLALDFIGRAQGTVGRQFAKIVREYVEVDES